MKKLVLSLAVAALGAMLAVSIGLGATNKEGTYKLSTESEFRTAITHVWLLCQAPSFFGTAEAGLEIRADGRWSKLERKPNGSLVRASGWGEEGSWGTFDTSAMNGPGTYEASFEIDGRGASYAMPIFGSGGSRVRSAASSG